MRMGTCTVWRPGGTRLDGGSASAGGGVELACGRACEDPRPRPTDPVDPVSEFVVGWARTGVASRSVAACASDATATAISTPAPAHPRLERLAIRRISVAAMAHTLLTSR